MGSHAQKSVHLHLRSNQYASFAFDATYTFLIAINNLKHQGLNEAWLEERTWGKKVAQILHIYEGLAGTSPGRVKNCKDSKDNISEVNILNFAISQCLKFGVA